jgi:SagB-type dehydrogenase family enzyme
VLTASPEAPRRYRRSSHLVVYWDQTGGVVYNYATGVKAQATPLLWRLLDRCSDWTDQAGIREAIGGNISDEHLERLVSGLLKAGFAETIDSAPHPLAAAMDGWGGWNPAAGFFHTASRQCVYGDWYAFDDRLKAKARAVPLPSTVKEPSAVSIPLSMNFETTPLDRVLQRRRTWRRFGKHPVDHQALADVLRATLGITHWLTLPELGEVPLTSSPSGGSRHPIEGYVAVLRVSGVPAGIYRYAPDRHELDLIRRDLTVEEVQELIPTQPWFGEAGFVVFLTALFERTHWKYEFARAYRAVLLEAGHVCQTFLLSATARGLAPFCTMAVDDRRVETLLGLDGIGEAVLYATGAGTRPRARARADLPGAGRADVRRHRILSARRARRRHA